MGLDMYLEGEVFVGGAYHAIKEPTLTVSKSYKNFDEPDYEDGKSYPTKDIDSVIYRVGYWRKANQIHHWFVQNCQNGEDDCRKHLVGEGQIEELKSLCEELLKTRDEKKALEFLPPQEGFFFGNSNPSNENFWNDYWADLEVTKGNLENALKYIHDFGADIYYQSSW